MRRAPTNARCVIEPSCARQLKLTIATRPENEPLCSSVPRFQKQFVYTETPNLLLVQFTAQPGFEPRKGNEASRPSDGPHAYVKLYEVTGPRRRSATHDKPCELPGNIRLENARTSPVERS